MRHARAEPKPCNLTFRKVLSRGTKTTLLLQFASWFSIAAHCQGGGFGFPGSSKQQPTLLHRTILRSLNSKRYHGVKGSKPQVVGRRLLPKTLVPARVGYLCEARRRREGASSLGVGLLRSWKFVFVVLRVSDSGRRASVLVRVVA